MSGHHGHETCLNCNAPLMGKYCASCGQKDQHERPEFYHFLHELLHEFVHVDGKILQSMKMLFFSPGKLTSEYWAGRRVAQVPPVRLYLVASVIMFGLLSMLPNAGRVPFEPTLRVTSSDYDNNKPHDFLELPVERRKQLVEQSISPHSRLGRYFREPLIKAADDPKEFRHRLLGNASKTMFVMLPLFALVTLVVFRRSHRVYLEQLVLALHIHTLAFLLFGAAAIISSEGQPSFRFIADLLLLPGIPVYTLITFRKVFGLTWLSTVLRSATVAVAYFAIFIVTEVALLVVTLSSFGAG